MTPRPYRVYTIEADEWFPVEWYLAPLIEHMELMELMERLERLKRLKRSKRSISGARYRLLDGYPVGVGGDHRQYVVLRDDLVVLVCDLGIPAHFAVATIAA